MNWKKYLILFFLTQVHGFLVHNTVKIQIIRKSIDIIDDQIHDLICARLYCAEQLKGRKPTIRDPIREVSIISRLKDKEKLDPTMIKNIWKTLFQESYRVQKSDDFLED